MQGYFAVTTNTAQFGAKAELFFGFSAISVEGHLGFDALFQFSPFKFVVADLRRRVASRCSVSGCSASPSTSP